MAKDELRYSEDHCWARQEDDGSVVIGLTEWAPVFQNRLLRVDLPAVGEEIVRDEECGDIEASHTVHDIVAPLSGTVTEINEEILESPVLLADDPMDEGWLFAIRPAELSQWRDLLTYAQYKELRDEYEEEEEEEEEEEGEDELYDDYDD
ncbi:MAG: glycine cleavage system protein H [Thermodesulfobacteriota bacterium]